jgi:hypothetical protein
MHVGCSDGDARTRKTRAGSSPQEIVRGGTLAEQEAASLNKYGAASWLFICCSQDGCLRPGVHSDMPRPVAVAWQGLPICSRPEQKHANRLHTRSRHRQTMLARAHSHPCLSHCAIASHRDKLRHLRHAPRNAERDVSVLGDSSGTASSCESIKTNICAQDRVLTSNGPASCPTSLVAA